MTEMKFIKPGTERKRIACCGPEQSMPQPANEISSKSHFQSGKKGLPHWIAGSLMTVAGAIPIISTNLTNSDKWEHVKCRISSFRNDYAVNPGLYAVGTPDRNSDVFASANYKLSFDALRKALNEMNAWILVLDTRGINVWCAAGKGTFGTEELINRISFTNLEKIVVHRKIIVPQLGAPGISAHKVSKASGFKVCYGPVRAEDISSYVSSGYVASKEMRTVTFPFIDRLILTPMELNPAMKRYYPWYAVIMLTLFGLRPEGIFFRDALIGGSPFLLLGILSVLAGALITPALLPFVPLRSFAVKGWIVGMLLTFCSISFFDTLKQLNTELLIFSYFFFPLASSYVALQFTGSTTFTGMSGVKRELKISIPLYIFGTVASLLLLLVYKLGEWRLI